MSSKHVSEHTPLQNNGIEAEAYYPILPLVSHNNATSSSLSISDFQDNSRQCERRRNCLSITPTIRQFRSALHWIVTLGLVSFVTIEKINVTQLQHDVYEQQQQIASQKASIDDSSRQLAILDGAVSDTAKRIAEVEDQERDFNRTVSNTQVVDRLAEVEATLDTNQAIVMGRLNETVKTVLLRLEGAVSDSNAQIRSELDETEMDVLERLSQTNKDLNDAVRNAKVEINNQVDTVRTNMNQVRHIVRKACCLK